MTTKGFFAFAPQNATDRIHVLDVSSNERDARGFVLVRGGAAGDVQAARGGGREEVLHER